MNGILGSSPREEEVIRLIIRRFLLQVSYFSASFDPVRLAERFPMAPPVLTGNRDRLFPLPLRLLPF